jgi:anti-sigma-K factor RskA
MNLSHHPELLDRLAAAYALGTLRGGARRRFEAQARHSPSIRAAALLWQERLVSLTELQPGEAPDPNVWKRIQNSLEAPPAAPAPSAPARSGWGWKAAALAGALATVAAVTVGLDLYRELAADRGALAQARQQGRELAQRNTQLMAQLQAQPEIRYVAVLADERANPSVLATFDPKHNRLTIKHVHGLQLAPDRSLQLWAVSGSGAPRSLGLLGAAQVERLLAVEPQLRDSQVLAVSLEPKGGAPGEGGPTGPVLFKGAVLQTPL